MPTPDFICEAVSSAAHKRRLLGADAARRLSAHLREQSIEDLAALRRWLKDPVGLSPDLAAKIRALLPGEDLPVFGTQHAIAHLADGGMGRVWLASAMPGPMTVVKTVKLPSHLDPVAIAERRQRFEREARITQSLSHPNVVRCLDSGSASDGQLYLVLEYVDSGDLRDLVDVRRRLPEPLALAVVFQVADALSEASRLKLVHRDIKPSNIFVGTDGRAKLADFGLARSTDDMRTKLTMAGAILGSPQYMSPEQVIGEDVLDIRSDIYALGAVLYYCLAGRPPFEGRVPDLLAQHCNVPAPDVRSMAVATSAETAALISACLEKDPARRPQTAEDLCARIEASLGKLGSTVKRVMEEETRTADLRSERADTPAARAEELTIVADLSGRQIDARSTEKTMISDLSGSRAEELTIVTDLSGAEAATRTLSRTGSMAIQELAATLIAEPAEAAPAVQPAKEAGSGSGSRAAAPSTAAFRSPDALEGDLSSGIAKDWIVLSPPAVADPVQIVLFAKQRLVMGKLKDAPVDLVLRNYPVPVHKDALQRLSRQHLAMSFDPIVQQVQVQDLATANGSELDAQPLNGSKSLALSGSSAHVLTCSGVVTLWLRVRLARSKKPVLPAGMAPAASSACGIDTDHTIDSVVITRTDNRPEMAYAMVLRRISVGGPGSDIVVGGAKSLTAVTVGRLGGRWVWRGGGDAPWRPLCAGQELDCGGRQLVAREGGYDCF